LTKVGKWPNRDPIYERGFRVLTNYRGLPFGKNEEKNLYGFVQGNPVSVVDPHGLWQWGWPPWGKKEKECCYEDDAGTKAAEDLANQAASGLVDNL